jgi:hypothetical protein
MIEIMSENQKPLKRSLGLHYINERFRLIRTDKASGFFL